MQNRMEKEIMCYSHAMKYYTTVKMDGLYLNALIQIDLKSYVEVKDPRKIKNRNTI